MDASLLWRGHADFRALSALCSSSGVETLLKEQTPSKSVVQGAEQWVAGGTGVER